MRRLIGCFAAMLVATPAAAQAGLGEKVYGATLESGVTELEARYGRVTGGEDDRAEAITLEAAHHFSSRFYGAVVVETERAPSGPRRVGAVALEGIVHVGRLEQLGLDVALYGEYGFQREGADTVETKLLLQHRAGAFDGRLNLIAEQPLQDGKRVEFGYAASADWSLVGDFRAGAAWFGDLQRGEHYAGPILKTEIERLPGHGELGIEGGYLFALANGRKEAPGQIRLLLEYEFHF